MTRQRFRRVNRLGATAVYPYLAYESLAHMVNVGAITKPMRVVMAEFPQQREQRPLQNHVENGHFLRVVLPLRAPV